MSCTQTAGELSRNNSQSPCFLLPVSPKTEKLYSDEIVNNKSVEEALVHNARLSPLDAYVHVACIARGSFAEVSLVSANVENLIALSKARGGRRFTKNKIICQSLTNEFDQVAAARLPHLETSLSETEGVGTRLDFNDALSEETTRSYSYGMQSVSPTSNILLDVNKSYSNTDCPNANTITPTVNFFQEALEPYEKQEESLLQNNVKTSTTVEKPQEISCSSATETTEFSAISRATTIRDGGHPQEYHSDSSSTIISPVNLNTQEKQTELCSQEGTPRDVVKGSDYHESLFSLISETSNVEHGISKLPTASKDAKISTVLNTQKMPGFEGPLGFRPLKDFRLQLSPIEGSKIYAEQPLFSIKQINKRNLKRENKYIINLIIERSLLSTFFYPLLVSLVRSFQDSQYLFFVFDFSPGGDMRSLLSTGISDVQQLYTPSKPLSSDSGELISHSDCYRCAYRSFLRGDKLYSKLRFIKKNNFQIYPSNIWEILAQAHLREPMFVSTLCRRCSSNGTEENRISGRMPVEAVFFYAVEIALSLLYLHQCSRRTRDDKNTLNENCSIHDGVFQNAKLSEPTLNIENDNSNTTYCDLKGENLLLMASGHLLLADFGTATISRIVAQVSGKFMDVTASTDSKYKKPPLMRSDHPLCKEKYSTDNNYTNSINDDTLGCYSKFIRSKLEALSYVAYVFSKNRFLSVVNDNSTAPTFRHSKLFVDSSDEDAQSLGIDVFSSITADSPKPSSPSASKKNFSGISSISKVDFETDENELLREVCHIAAESLETDRPLFAGLQIGETFTGESIMDVIPESVDHRLYDAAVIALNRRNNVAYWEEKIKEEELVSLLLLSEAGYIYGKDSVIRQRKHLVTEKNVEVVETMLQSVCDETVEPVLNEFADEFHNCNERQQSESKLESSVTLESENKPTTNNEKVSFVSTILNGALDAVNNIFEHHKQAKLRCKARKLFKELIKGSGSSKDVDITAVCKNSSENEDDDFTSRVQEKSHSWPLTLKNIFGGTTAYMAPEMVLLGTKQNNNRTKEPPVGISKKCLSRGRMRFHPQEDVQNESIDEAAEGRKLGFLAFEKRRLCALKGYKAYVVQFQKIKMFHSKSYDSGVNSSFVEGPNNSLNLKITYNYPSRASTTKIGSFGSMSLSEARARNFTYMKALCNALQLSDNILRPKLIFDPASADFSTVSAINSAVDWWAYGCLLFEMQTGKRAFTSEEPANNSASALDLSSILTGAAPALSEFEIYSRITKRMLNYDENVDFVSPGVNSAIKKKTFLYRKFVPRCNDVFGIMDEIYKHNNNEEEANDISEMQNTLFLLRDLVMQHLILLNPDRRIGSGALSSMVFGDYDKRAAELYLAYRLIFIDRFYNKNFSDLHENQAVQNLEKPLLIFSHPFFFASQLLETYGVRPLLSLIDVVSAMKNECDKELFDIPNKLKDKVDYFYRTLVEPLGDPLKLRSYWYTYHQHYLMLATFNRFFLDFSLKRLGAAAKVQAMFSHVSDSNLGEDEHLALRYSTSTSRLSMLDFVFNINNVNSFKSYKKVVDAREIIVGTPLRHLQALAAKCKCNNEPYSNLCSLLNDMDQKSFNILLGSLTLESDQSKRETVIQNYGSMPAPYILPPFLPVLEDGVSAAADFFQRGDTEIQPCARIIDLRHFPLARVYDNYKKMKQQRCRRVHQMMEKLNFPFAVASKNNHPEFLKLFSSSCICFEICEALRNFNNEGNSLAQRQKSASLLTTSISTLFPDIILYSAVAKQKMNTGKLALLLSPDGIADSPPQPKVVKTLNNLHEFYASEDEKCAQSAKNSSATLDAIHKVISENRKEKVCNSQNNDDIFENFDFVNSLQGESLQFSKSALETSETIQPTDILSARSSCKVGENLFGRQQDRFFMPSFSSKKLNQSSQRKDFSFEPYIEVSDSTKFEDSSNVKTCTSSAQSKHGNISTARTGMTSSDGTVVSNQIRPISEWDSIFSNSENTQRMFCNNINIQEIAANLGLELTQGTIKDSIKSSTPKTRPLAQKTEPKMIRPKKVSKLPPPAPIKGLKPGTLGRQPKLSCPKKKNDGDYFVGFSYERE